MSKEEDALPDYGTKSEEPVQDKTFVIFGSNGNWIIEKSMKELGWKPLADKFTQNFMLKWVESRLSVNYDNFKEGEQLVNRIPNCYMLTNKLGLLVNLHRFQGNCNNGEYPDAPKIKIADFLPETYRIDDQNDRNFFLQRFKRGEVWISKPIGLNQGRGIYLVRDADAYKARLKEADKATGGCRLIQRYMTNPLLMDGKKFDIRVYMLIASTKPYLVLFRKGYIRLSLHKYNSTSEDITVHLTNQFIQRKCSFYDSCKNETICSYEKFNNYINKNVALEKKLETDWVHKTLWNRMKEIALVTFLSVKDKFKAKVGYFDLYGFDFLVDEDMKIWLLEVNVNPCLSTNCDHLRVIIPDVIQETLHIALECYKKCQQKKGLLPLSSQRTFETLFYEGLFCQPSTSTLVKVVPLHQLVQQYPPQTSVSSPHQKSNIISVVFDPDKSTTIETKSMFEMAKKEPAQEQKDLVTTSNQHHNNSDNEIKKSQLYAKNSLSTAYSNQGSEITNKSKEGSSPEEVSGPDNSGGGHKKKKVEVTEAESQQLLDELNIRLNNLLDFGGTFNATGESLTLVGGFQGEIKNKEKPVKVGSYKKVNISDDTRTSKQEKPLEKEIKKEKFYEINNKMIANDVHTLITDQGRSSRVPKMEQSTNHTKDPESPSPNRNREVKVVRFSETTISRDNKGSSKSRSNSKEQDPRTSRSATGNNQSQKSRPAMTTSSALYHLRNPQGTTNFIAANKQLVQTLAKMNIEKRVKHLQSKFYHHSISPT